MDPRDNKYYVARLYAANYRGPGFPQGYDKDFFCVFEADPPYNAMIWQCPIPKPDMMKEIAKRTPADMTQFESKRTLEVQSQQPLYELVKQLQLNIQPAQPAGGNATLTTAAVKKPAVKKKFANI